MWIVRVLMLGLVLTASGCGGNTAEEAQPATQATQATAATAAAPCGEEGVEVVNFATGEGGEVEAALVGDGDTGVVLGHQFRSNFCSWVPFAKQLAARDMRALAINFSSTSLDDDVVAGAEELRRRGAKRVFLVGASMGGTAALVGAEEADAARVASLSGPRQFSGLDALPSVRRLTIPTLFLVGRQDTEFAREARRLYEATASDDKKLVVTDGFEHGTDLLQDPKAERALLEFLTGP
jgi:pimeloyl-ACP methyl ester carboxylesterase